MLIQFEGFCDNNITQYYNFKDTLKAFDDFKNKQKNVWSNIFWSVKVCIFSKCIQYTKWLNG